MSTPHPTSDQIKELVAFLPRLLKMSTEDLDPWRESMTQANDVASLPENEYDPLILAFFEAAAEPCWSDHDYLNKNPERMLDNLELIKAADLDQIRTMLTFCVRGERFCSGFWTSIIGDGSVERLLERLAEF